MASSVDWQIDYLLAGNDIDVVVNDSIQGTDLGDVADGLINLYNPPNGIGAPPARADSQRRGRRLQPDERGERQLQGPLPAGRRAA